MALELSGTQQKDLRGALIDAFPGWDELERMCSDYLELNLATVAAESRPLETNAFDLIKWADAKGRMNDLVSAARFANPDNPKLFIFTQKIGITSTAEKKSILEAFVGPNVTFLDVAVWRAQLSRLEWKMCRVDVDGKGIGTGFLIGPDVVLTNHHVAVYAMTGGTIDPKRLSCLFDYKIAEDEVLSDGVRLSLADDDAIIAMSPHSPHDVEPDPKSGEPSNDELDFALLRLAEPAGELPPGGFSAASNSRGWLTLDSTAVDFTAMAGVSILQHPRLEPLKLALGMQQEVTVNGAGNRIRYTVPTQPGSSGSPVFDSDWRLVALHHAGDPDTVKPEYNEGIPISTIAQHAEVAAYLTELADNE